jgi:hypothetical protein
VAGREARAGLKGGRVQAEHSVASLRAATAERLRGRREEIHEAVIHRALSVAPPTGQEEPGYVEALRAAIPSAVEHAFDVIEVGEERVGPTPAAVLVQAAASARSEVGLEVVVRRYAAGYTILSDFLHQETRRLGGESIRGCSALQRDLSALFDRFVVEVAETYNRTGKSAVPSPEERRLERVRRLMAGDLVDPALLEYPIKGSHLAVIVSGQGHEEAVAGLARRLDRHLLVGDHSIGRSAVWLGGTRALSDEELGTATMATAKEGLRLTLGEPGEGLTGWRRTRRQAEAADRVAERCGNRVVRYRDVALLAAALSDPDLAHFLSETYVEALGRERSSLGRTVMVFFELNGNASSAAAELGVTRHTVAARLRVVEERLGRPLGECAAQLETALRLDDLTA